MKSENDRQKAHEWSMFDSNHLFWFVKKRKQRNCAHLTEMEIATAGVVLLAAIATDLFLDHNKKKETTNGNNATTWGSSCMPSVTVVSLTFVKHPQMCGFDAMLHLQKCFIQLCSQIGIAKNQSTVAQQQNKPKNPTKMKFSSATISSRFLPCRIR